ncbi:RNA polymerase sigma factor [Pedobacter cryoconitis]|uniref:RNA polymerase sigma-70 factor (ECF subfamily) n=1 Tax=Pedobacter cryoconitis TaxID=188932 RepID=A0A7X0J6E5_9SPHI|nr:RNA polymerase sigma-70 factor [Pedobacter cryoconitis]MBB6501940.1 RNA polymerase sigma-70 factor (ECF subfamily) [Pedobacter cryoconitis]
MFHSLSAVRNTISYGTLSDQELSGLIQVDDEAAFNEIYKRYWERLYVVARHRTDDTYEAEEIVQDIFCNLWRKRNEFVLTKGFLNYFSVAVKFEVINRLAKRNRENRLKKEVSVFSSLADESTVDQLNYNELQSQLALTIKVLPEKCMLVFKLKHEEGYSQKQIAEELNIAEKTVEAHLAKARKTIRIKFSYLSAMAKSLLFL